jgi:hypothetical protein
MADAKRTNEPEPSVEGTSNDCETNGFVLRLYVANSLPISICARRNIEALCSEYLNDSCDLKVIDIYKEPGVARKKQIVATPTLVR